MYFAFVDRRAEVVVESEVGLKAGAAVGKEQVAAEAGVTVERAEAAAEIELDQTRVRPSHRDVEAVYFFKIYYCLLYQYFCKFIIIIIFCYTYVFFCLLMRSCCITWIP